MSLWVATRVRSTTQAAWQSHMRVALHLFLLVPLYHMPLLIAGWTHAALLSVRNIPIFCIVAAPPVAAPKSPPDGRTRRSVSPATQESQHSQSHRQQGQLPGFARCQTASAATARSARSRGIAAGSRVRAPGGTR